MLNQISFEEIALAITYIVCIFIGIFLIYFLWDSDNFSSITSILLSAWFGFCCGFLGYALYSVVKDWF